MKETAMKYLETLSQLHVNEAIQTGIDSQAIHRALSNDPFWPKEATMSTKRLFALPGYAKFGLFVAAAALAACLSAGFLGFPPIVGSSLGQPHAGPSVMAAEQARLVFRRGEWSAGSYNPYAVLDQHERHLASAASDPEIQRFIAHANSLTEQARLAQRHGEWLAGTVVIDPEIQRFVAYSQALAEQARLDQRRGEWQAGK
jgi:hypothetical protein